MDPNALGRFGSYAGHAQVRSERPCSVSAEMKARQSSKIRELAETVEAAGFLTLDEQAEILEVPRSTAWTIRRGATYQPLLCRYMEIGGQDRGQTCELRASRCTRFRRHRVRCFDGAGGAKLTPD